MDKERLLYAKNLSVYYDVQESQQWFWQSPKSLRAVDELSFDLFKGETLGIVGESGCGKSTLAKAIVGLSPITKGKLVWRGQDISLLKKLGLRDLRSNIQMIFQDPLASLNPRMTIGDIIAEPLMANRKDMNKRERKIKVEMMMDKVGLLPNLINRYPHEFSGGQCQRIGIARALILEPSLVICDEPISALDVSIQAQIINLLQSLQAEMALTLLFISHDLSVVKHISDRVMVMYLGHSVEVAQSRELYDHPLHPYTKILMQQVPIPDPKKARKQALVYLEGELPSPINPPSGCVFRTRCPLADEVCAKEKPFLKGRETHKVACLKVDGC